MSAAIADRSSWALRALRRWVQVEPHEARGLACAFLCALTMFASYAILRPVRDTMGITSGLATLPQLFWGTFACMLVLQPVYGWVVSRFDRGHALPRIYACFAASLVAFWAWFHLQADHAWIARAYFVWISVLNLFVVALFWSLMADVFDSGQASRFFGVIAAGFSIGGLAGPLLAGVLAAPLGTINLLLVAAALLGMSAWLMQAMARWARAQARSRHVAVEDRPLRGSAWAAFAQVSRSPLLVAMAVFVLLLTSVSTVLYLQQQQVVAATFHGADARTAFFAKVDFGVQLASLAAQLLLFSRLMRRFGFTAMLVSVPLLMVGGFAAIGANLSLRTVMATMVVRRVGEYAITRPCRDMLMTVVSREEKYKAKGLIDTFVYRGGDALSASAFAGVTSASSLGAGATLAIVGVGLSLAWWGVAAWLGRRYAALAKPLPAHAEAADEMDRESVVTGACSPDAIRGPGSTTPDFIRATPACATTTP